MTDQLAILKSRGLLVDNEPAALNYLARIGYYRLSGYWYPLRVIDTETSLQEHRPVRFDHFMPESHFEDVVKLYVFDKKLRLLALDALERIEMALRVDIAHRLGEKDPCAHLNPDCLHGNFAKKAIIKGPNKGKTEHQVWLEKYDTMLKRARREPFIAHHREKYDGCLPIWVAIEVWDFGLLSRLFEGMQFTDKNQVAQKYGLADGAQLAKWLKSLNFVRNVSAHHSRPFMYFAIMAKLLAVICPNSSWTQRLIALINDFPSSRNGMLTLQDLGVVEGAVEWLSQFQK
ncbi:Abi family protein [Alkalimonas amylolytica]|uniref:Abortive infection bacteriophage resistance protein n=1 Tax=Alkalimonas amylolytica TaxID=152573 RepID=A0A1H4FF36_ALKAM|nr:Abi family protein [Alkalimonas amylolytica]SEA95969.1 Abortive infection bacteriophage resistance protein [Alkalimonas amylolytica]